MTNSAQDAALKNLQFALEGLDKSTLLEGKELGIEYNKASLNPCGTGVPSGIVIEFLDGYTVGELLEATQLGASSFKAILEDLTTWETASSMLVRHAAFYEAHQRLDDFAEILGEIHDANLPEVEKTLSAIAEAGRCAEGG